VIDHDDIERRNEANEGAHPSAGTTYSDEYGDFRVRVVLQSECEERLVYANASLRCALAFADIERGRLSKPWRDAGRNPAAHVHVDVIDMEDPERGGLDWDVLS
jgi:hypothetical protein